MVADSNHFAVIDGANEEGLLDMLANVDPPHSCLYLEPVQPDLIAIAPYLVQLTDDVRQWLSTRESKWGIYVSSTSNLQAVRKHLRKFLQVLLPNEDKPAFFRFYDPRNIWDLAEVLSDWELHTFLGPIDEVATVTEGLERRESFQDRRAQYPRDASSKAKLMRFDETHMRQFDVIYQSRYLAKLDVLFPSVADKDDTLTSSLFNYFKKNGITDDRSVRGLVQLFDEKEIENFDAFKKAYSWLIEDQSDPGHYRAESLLIKELGYVPA
ncbi:DUF4123 domain-containing protein [Enterovibrio norvegicus]|uniref:DUF4123 domain-containing protein n=1 Tax=Enterovibrio norvegicus TaxID=188144 RepID=UPI003D096CF4